MTKPLVIDLSGLLGEHVRTVGETADYVLRNFPDGETYLQLLSSVKGRQVVFVQSLDNPNPKIMPLLLFAQLVREQGAAQMTLLAPYLAYMRQDKVFHPGEAVSAKYFAMVISPYFDRLITIDPHLHRMASLDEIYTLKSTVLHATAEIAAYIQTTVKKPLIVGPDGESQQWAKDIAEKINAPMVIAEKIRHGDYDVDVTISGVEAYRDHTPVLVDDIISTAQTMIKAIHYIKRLNTIAPVCIGVHAVFAGSAYEDLRAVGPERIVTCNTIVHPSNHIDLRQLMASAL